MKTFRAWKEATKDANEPGKKIGKVATMRRAFSEYRKNARISRSLKEKRAKET